MRSHTWKNDLEIEMDAVAIWTNASQIWKRAFQIWMDDPEIYEDDPEIYEDDPEIYEDDPEICEGARVPYGAAVETDRTDSRLDSAAPRPGDAVVSVDVNAVARDAIRLAQLGAGATIALHASFFEPLPRVEGSPEQLSRAICDLLVNARESLDGVEGGAIEIETEPDGDLVAVRILDNGPGMSEGQLERAFDPFAREGAPDDEPDRKPSKDVSGLADADEILRDHGGTLTVRSRPGEGTCCIALLPIRRA
jgi:nitrogen-specific signal transduction histidine kinase